MGFWLGTPRKDARSSIPADERARQESGPGEPSHATGPSVAQRRRAEQP